MAVASALHHAHEQRSPDGRPLELVHRDVSPSNVIVGYDGTVKVVDFGIAKAALRTVQTSAGTLRGKAAYMAPEQCAGRPLDRRADVFALGIVLWELVTARRLFKGANDFMTMAAIVAGRAAARATSRRPPADFEKIILKALSPGRKRFQTAEQVGFASRRWR
jgi:serine/threonine protein kinase